MRSKLKIKINVKFVDFWSNFDQKNNFFVNLLRDKYDFIFSDNPDYLIYSVYGNSHLKYNCVKIFFTGENIIPDFNCCDYALGFHDISFENRYFRLPLYLLNRSTLDLVETKHIFRNDEIKQKTGFCNFIYSNKTGILRNIFFEKLSQYKFVDSGGNFNNNIGFKVGDKLEFQKKFKFSIAFENSYGSGYTTEKIMDAFAAKTIPIYWGNPSVNKDFNPKAFINVHDYSSLDEVVNEVIEIDNDDNLLLSYLSEPVFEGIKKIQNKDLINFFDNIFTNSFDLVLNKKYYGIWYENHLSEIKISSNFRYNQVFKPIRFIINKFLKRG